MKIHENLKMLCKNDENHDNRIIPNENHENHRIPFENHENYENSRIMR